MTETDYRIEQYRDDVTAAHAVYERIIAMHCTDKDGNVRPLTPDQITAAKKEAFALRNQHLSAAGKRLRLGIALRMLDRLDGRYDMTATLAKRITERLLGRAVNRKLLLDRYATTHRTAATKSADFKQLPQLDSDPDFQVAQAKLVDALAEAAMIREEIKEQRISPESPAYKMLSASAKAGEPSLPGGAPA